MTAETMRIRKTVSARITLMICHRDFTGLGGITFLPYLFTINYLEGRREGNKKEDRRGGEREGEKCIPPLSR